MEPVSISEKSRRKRKKRKSQKKDSETVVKPECFDGMTNWLHLQKTLEKTKERVPKRLNGDKNKPFKRLTKKRRLMHSDSTSPKKKGKMDNHSDSFENSKNDSGWVSGSELGPENSTDLTEANGNSTNEFSDYDSLKELTKVLSMDCEMVGTGPDGKDSILARVSIVNAYGQCVYDEFVKPKEKVTDYRTHISGVRPSDLRKGKDLFEVQTDVSTMIEGRRIVGHDLKHDFNVLFISHPRSLIRDTSKYKPFREISGGKTPSLRKLTSMILGCNIQSGEHSSVEDAQAAMLLYLRHKKDWERQIKNLRKRKPAQ
ncbi:uncharacterized protein [Parasteatoda tepidariorum]|uniref:uncharacterized protein isoform X1 n=1 Tax=Parasteatoda tepidariorum TaxID=114398 RepID=UPI001C72176C|nr:RNA exonuclease 4 [Parasteatoda tepidariorum]